MPVSLSNLNFSVSGKVINLTGEPVNKARLLAFDIDLKAAAVYRTVKSLEDIKKNGGFELLGETSSDAKGFYSITFSVLQYLRAERKKADVIVFTAAGDEITGRSHMVNSEEYNDTSEVRDLDILIIKKQEKTEYELLMGNLNAFLKESGVSLAQLATSDDQVKFTSGELDEDETKVRAAALAEALRSGDKQVLSHELLYGIGRQQIQLDWVVLYKKKNDELESAITASFNSNIIKAFTKEEIAAFLTLIHEYASQFILEYKGTNQTVSLDKMLSAALPQSKQRLAFANAVRSFNGDYKIFWKKILPNDPAFKEKPELISALLFSQQLILISGNHQPLIEELQVSRKVPSVTQLLELKPDDWKGIFAKTGVPEFIIADKEDERIRIYTEQIQTLLNAAYPTQKIAVMLKNRELPVKDANVANGMSTFINTNKQFDISTSRITDFEKEIKVASPEHFEKTKQELQSIQRIFQVSPTSDAMPVLMKSKLDSAYSITSIPKKSFIQMHGEPLGGELMAEAVYQRATYINTRATEYAVKMRDLSHGAAPAFVLSKSDHDATMDVLKKNIPNYAELFGSPDMCECEHCRSVYSAAAYFVDLLRFLSWGAKNDDIVLPDFPNGKSPLDMFAQRRPDLLQLPLTCENTNTIIPYIDLVNEVMEYYTVHGPLKGDAVQDTGETIMEELRANPQNVDAEAYRILKDAVYPFSLPYHQPLDVVRTYSDHLKTARYDVMLGMQKDLSQITERAIESEALRISEEEYIVLTGKKFDGTDDTRLPYEYFGYSNATELERMAGTGVTDGIHEFLRRSGMTYTELVELIKTKFINPHQNILDYLEQLFVNSGMNASVIYNKLQQIKSGILIPSSDTDVMAALISANISSGDFVTWVQSHFDDFDSVITLFQSNSMCDLDTTCLRTIKNVYSGITASGITDDTNAMWLKIHRFIRLWRKLGWKINEVDLMLTALSEDDITQDTISKLSQTVLLNKELKLPLNRLATLWGSIDTYGEKSLFKILFLNKAVQKIDTAFEADKFGKYLSDETKKLQDHVPAILAAFRMSEEDLQAILSIATVIDQGNPRPFNIASDILNITNLSTIYRYTVLSKALKLKVPDCCLLISLFNATPFSSFDIQQDKFVNITPADTFDFYKLAGSVKKAGFKPVTLQYIFKGTLPAESKLGLDTDKVKQTARTIREAFASIEQDHPEIPAAPFTSEILKSKLLLTFQPETVNLLMAIVDGTASFTSLSQKNLRITIPEDLSLKYSYINGSGRIICKGIMSEDEKAALLAINANDAFRTGVESIYSAPEIFIADNFCNTIDGAECVFKEKELAFANLLNHPVQTPEKAPDEKLYFIYSNYLPLLKQKLHKDAIIQNIASLIGVSEVATAVLLQDELHSLIDSIALQGFSADYFSDTNWTTPELKRTDREIDFAWSQESPDPSLPADNFSVRWQSFISPPSGGEYTLIVDVREADEAFNLYLDEALILQKAAADVRTSLEVVSLLNASQMYKVVIEYSERIGNAGIALSWKTATTAKETIPPASSFPADVIDNFIKTVKTFHQSAKFIAGFKLTDKEVNHFANYRTDFDNFDFKTITPTHWKQINNYVRLRNAVPQSQSLLTDVFVYANIIDPVPTIDSLTKKLSLSTGWDTTTVSYLINDYFGLTVDKFKNEVDISRIYAAVSFVLKTGLSAQTMAELAAPETDFDKLNTTADLVKRAVKAKYEDEDWLKIAGNLSDTTRENQKQALISYLLTKQELIDWGAVDADGLFEYFLIDVQMGPCMDTSRIVQATAAVQQFVSRCLLNLESDIQGGLEKGVSPAAIDTDRWEWMKNYRVSEANRKVFLYPENWLEPEWRDDRSPFFKELESELIQNDITTRSVETAFRNYLTKLNTVANLEILGTYQENDVEGNFSMLHVVGTTNNPPYQYFYRTWNAFMKWSAWEKVQVDIRSVDEGENSGVHLMPLVWKGRRFILFTEFIQKVQKNSDNDNKTADALSKQPMSQLNPTKYWEIRLAWTEYIDGKWSPKQLTKEFIRGNGGEPCNYTYHTYINPTTNGLTVSLTYQGTSLLGGFMLADIQSKVFAYDFSGPRSFEFQFSPSLVVNTTLTARIFDSSVEQGFQDAVFYNPPDENYRNFFMKHKKNGHFLFNSDVYLDKIIDHKILYSSQVLDFETTINYPFFYTDDKRTYFVRPIDVKILDQVKQPDLYFPPAIQFIDSSRKGSPLPVAIDSKIKTDAPTPGYKTPKLTDLSVIGKAFGFGKPLSDTGKHPNWHTGKGMEFHTFYHPFSSQYVTNLNQEGIKGLMDSDTKLNEENQLLYNDSGDGFINNYNPNFQQRFVRKAPESNDYKAGEAYTFYKENICFDVYGANSIYNWELFFQAPLYIATRLSKDGKFEEAMKWFHYIFDPTTDELPIAGQSETSRYWKTLPFKTTPSENLEQMFSALTLNDNPLAENPAIAEWRKNPFKPFKVAENRPIAFKKNVVMKYVENLIAWGDSLFRMFTRESVNEALQIYVIANHILGPRPQLVPKRGKIKAETYDSLKDKWDDFGNALVELENVFPYSGEIPVSSSNTGPGLLGIGSALYFCIPGNEKLMEYWDTAADRLYKIRHCMDIDGVERQLALFSPVIDPAMLINATAQGLSLGSILADLSSPPPIYRFNYLIQRANDFCLEVKSLGSTLLSVLEKKDGEELGRLRASHETIILELMTAIKERQVLDAKVTGEGLQKARETAELRLHYYNSLLNPEDITVPDAPTTDANLTIDSQLPVDTSLAEIQTDVDVSLIESNERGVKLIGKEKQDIDLGNSSANNQITAMGAEIIAGFLGLIPQFNEIGTPLGVGASTGFGGRELGWFASTIAKTHSTQASIDSINSGQSAKMAGYIRREQEWTLQANLAIREIIQLDKQITSADIRVQISEKELENHKAQIENSKQVELFLKDKFTNQELYQWMKEQFFTVYKQSFNMAYDMAKKVEKCYQYETGNESTNFIQYGYWDNSQQGLCAGEKLHLSLRQMEKSYLEENKREFELTKSISISIINPVALQELKATGKCFVSVPEELFDLDYQGHYFRRIKSVSLSIPCIAGPYISANCTLRLLKNIVRLKTTMNDDGLYEHNNDEGIWIDDDRFRESNVPVKSIATSTGQRDSGMFELNFRDERYLPFEGAGAISEWKIELTEAEELRQFDYYSISDVILHMSYTAREEAILKTPAIDNLKTILSDETKGKIFPRLISLKNDFPDEFHTMRSDVSTENVAKEFKITKLFFPYLSNNYEIKFKSCSFYKKDGSVVTEITGAAASDIIDDNWVLSLNYNPITIKNLEDIYLLINYTLVL